MKFSVVFLRYKIRHRKRLLKTLFFILSFCLMIKLAVYTQQTYKNHECNLLKKELKSKQIDTVFYVIDYSNEQKSLINATNRLYENNEFNKLYSHYKIQSHVKTNKNKYVNINSNLRDKHINKQFYLIIEYTKVFGKSKYCNKKVDYTRYKHLFTNDVFTSLNITVHKRELDNTNTYDLLDSCLYKNCFFTCDRRYISYADAILFHEEDLSSRLEKSCQNYDGPESSLDDYVSLLAPVSFRKRDQIWLLWNDGVKKVPSSLDAFMFNWTLSYRSESEASFGFHGMFTNSHENKDIDEFVHKQNIFNSFKRRKYQAVWLSSSNCEGFYRQTFARQLLKKSRLYVFGPCANYVKNEANKFKNIIFAITNNNFETDILKESKFSLSFESNNCTDYISDTFWRALSFGLIPVVIQPAKVYYERISPTKSFIHAEDFNYDYRKLADHLNKVSNDFELYYSYFKWAKDTIDFSSNVVYGKKLEQLRMCELCMKLNKETSEIYYKSVSNYFNHDCVAN